MKQAISFFIGAFCGVAILGFFGGMSLLSIMGLLMASFAYSILFDIVTKK